MYINPESVLRWIHILAMVYWLGGEWGVFQTSYNVANPKLSLDERRRHMETAYRIDILARTGIILLLPLGLHMGVNLGVHDYGGGWLWVVWIVAFAWLALTWAAFVHRDTDRGLRLTKIDEAIRYVVIPALFVAAIWSYLTDWPFRADWYSTKVLIYSLLLVIGLGLRFIMRHWVPIFRELAEKGPNPALEKRLSSELAIGRGMAYVYWIGIASVAFLGATKPF